MRSRPDIRDQLEPNIAQVPSLKDYGRAEAHIAAAVSALRRVAQTHQLAPGYAKYRAAPGHVPLRRLRKVVRGTGAHIRGLKP
jgi:hypothetical protein